MTSDPDHDNDNITDFEVNGIVDGIQRVNLEGVAELRDLNDELQERFRYAFNQKNQESA